MKEIEIPLNNFQKDNVFRPIRNKVDYARLLLWTSRYILMNMNIGNLSDHTLKIKFNKSMRLFIYSKDKFFSVAFPFFIEINSSRVEKITTFKGYDLNSYAISSALSILNDEDFLRNLSLTEYYLNYDSSSYFDLETDIDLGISILEEIFQFEPSYIRYDYDELRNDSDKHPLNHFDICYSSHGTFKIGLEERIDKSFFENFLDLNTSCNFLK